MSRKKILTFGLFLVITIFLAGFTIFVNGKSDAAKMPLEQTEAIVQFTESTTKPTTETNNPTIEAIDPTTETIEPTEAAKVEKVPNHLNPDWVAPNGLTNREMLAIVIYQEAGGNGSCDNCRRYVGDVVLNRVESKRFSYADSIDDVLLAYKQYGMFYKTGIKWPKRASADSEQAAVKRAYEAADDLLSGNHSKLYGKGYIWQAEFKQGKSGFWCCGTYYGK